MRHTASAWESRAACVQLLPGAQGCRGGQQLWVCPIPTVCRLAGRAWRWHGMQLGGKAVGYAGDSSMAGLRCRVGQGILQPLSRVVTGLADSTAVVRQEIRSAAFPGSSGSGEKAEPTRKSDWQPSGAGGDGGRWLHLSTAFYPITYFLIKR